MRFKPHTGNRYFTIQPSIARLTIGEFETVASIMFLTTAPTPDGSRSNFPEIVISSTNREYVNPIFRQARAIEISIGLKISFARIGLVTSPNARW